MYFDAIRVSVLLVVAIEREVKLWWGRTIVGSRAD